MKFRQLMLDLTEMDPFTNVTIASVCMAVYRNLFLEEQWVIKLVEHKKNCITNGTCARCDKVLAST